LSRLAEECRTGRTELDALRREIEGQRAARQALEGALRAAEARRQAAPDSELATAAVQAFADLVAPLGDYGTLLTECLDPCDPRRARALRLVEMAKHAGDLASRLLALRPQQSRDREKL